MAKLKRKKHSPAGQKHIKSMVAAGKKWKGGKWVDTMATKGLNKRLRRVSPELVEKKAIPYYGGSKYKRETADAILRRLKGK